MKKVWVLLFIPVVFCGCRVTLTRPLKGNYPSEYTVNINKTPDEVWNKVIAYCRDHRISLKLTDKKSGVILSDPYEVTTYSFENPDGTPELPSAIAIVGCETIRSFRNDCQRPTAIWGKLVFKLKKEENVTTLMVMLTDLAAWYNRGGSCLRDVKSTGFLEKQLLEHIR
ncbi:hypothetical protein [Emticicia fluvialis]|uniref:hypothetical protein n=1 Tax=Emticicia fluvialis TaxID=2974474 RepID=UPI0021653897|nr:hypothetical protein [Emticicia fluvialis]